jgi:hypothetical protein
MSGIFISYRRKDASGYAGRLAGDLMRRYGRSSVFLDIDSISGGTVYSQRIDDALDSSDITLVLIGDGWVAAAHDQVKPKKGNPLRRIDNKDDWVRREVSGALKRDGVTVLPILVEEASIPDPADLPTELKKLPTLECRELRNKDWANDVRKICSEVDRADPDGFIRRLLRRVRVFLSEGSRAAKLGAFGLAAVVLGALAFGASGSVRSAGAGCVNKTIPQNVRDQLSSAANSQNKATQGSVYYGTCGAGTWAIAKFPDGTDGVFRQSGFRWIKVGSLAAEECTAVPGKLLAAWSAAC